MEEPTMSILSSRLRSLLAAMIVIALLTGSLVWAKKPPKPPPEPPPEPPPCPSFEYSATWLEPLLGSFRGDRALGMNDVGDVVGKSYVGDTAVRAILWPATGGVVDLNDQIDPNGPWVLWHASDINNLGVIVGAGYCGEDWRAFRFDPANRDDDGHVVVEHLGTLPGGTHSEAWAINDRGDIAGRCTLPDRTAGFYLPAGGSLVDIGVLTEGKSVYVDDMNEFGVITGEALEASNPSFVHYYAFRYSEYSGIENIGALDEKARTLFRSEADGINDWGQVVGHSHPKEVGDGLFPKHAFLYSDGIGMVDLGTLGGSYSGGTAINNDAYVVGWSDTETGTSAFLYHQKYGMLDLTALTPNLQLPPSTDAIETVAINEFLDVDGDDTVEGQIVGSVGYPDPVSGVHVWQAFVLTPVNP
jgi:probable HAF family extracellular repeat protein